MWLTQRAETVPGFHATLTVGLSRLSGNCFPRPFLVAPVPSLLLPRYIFEPGWFPLSQTLSRGPCHPGHLSLGHRLGEEAV